MTESEWLACTEPHLMLRQMGCGWLAFGDALPRPSNRKLRLWVEACRAMAGLEDREWGNYDIDTPSGLGAACDRWGRAAQSVLPVNPLPARAALLRDVVGNPFRPVTLPWRCRECGIPCGPPAAGYYCVKCGSDEAGRCPWLTPTVHSLAEAAYEERPVQPHKRCECGTAYEMLRKKSTPPLAWCRKCRKDGGWYADAVAKEDGTLDHVRLMVLADALEEAGCPPNETVPGTCHVCDGKGKVYGCGTPYDSGWETCEKCDGKGLVSLVMPNPLLAHLRSPGPHVRGCFAIDLILNRE